MNPYNITIFGNGLATQIFLCRLSQWLSQRDISFNTINNSQCHAPVITHYYPLTKPAPPYYLLSKLSLNSLKFLLNKSEKEVYNLTALNSNLFVKYDTIFLVSKQNTLQLHHDSSDEQILLISNKFIDKIQSNYTKPIDHLINKIILNETDINHIFTQKSSILRLKEGLRIISSMSKPDYFLYDNEWILPLFKFNSNFLTHDGNLTYRYFLTASGVCGRHGRNDCLFFFLPEKNLGNSSILVAPLCQNQFYLELITTDKTTPFEILSRHNRIRDFFHLNPPDKSNAYCMHQNNDEHSLLMNYDQIPIISLCGLLHPKDIGLLHWRSQSINMGMNISEFILQHETSHQIYEQLNWHISKLQKEYSVLNKLFKLQSRLIRWGLMDSFLEAGKHHKNLQNGLLGLYSNNREPTLCLQQVSGLNNFFPVSAYATFYIWDKLFYHYHNKKNGNLKKL